MKKYIAILAAALAAPALAGALDGVPVLGTAPGGVTIYDKPCLSGNKADEGFVAVRGQQAGCFIEEGNYKARIEWLSSGRIERVDEAKTRAPAPPVYRDQYGNQTKSPLQLCKESRAAGNPVTEFCFRQFQGEAWFGRTHRGVQEGMHTTMNTKSCRATTYLRVSKPDDAAQSRWGARCLLQRKQAT